MKSSFLGLLALASGLVVSGIAAPAAQAEVQYADISAPTSVDVGWSGTVQVFAQAYDYEGNGDSLTFSVERPDGRVIGSATYPVTDTADLTIPITLVRPGTHHLVVTDDDAGWVLDETWIDVRPSISLSLPGAKPAAFYPLVRDGFKDRTAITYVANRTAAARVTVSTSAGRVVARDAFTARQGRHQWTWNGAADSGKALRPGTYTVAMSATAGGVTTTAKTAVQVVTDTVRTTKTLTKGGRETSRRRATGECHANVYSYDDQLSLDCWDFFGSGSRAEATWRFAVPSEATRVRWSIRGEEGCCDDGRVERSARRSGDALLVKMLVTGTRSFSIDRVVVTYTAQRRR